MDYIKLADLLFPDVINTVDYYIEKYPERNLPEGAKVARFAPSPTGFVHFGAIFGALIDERLAHRSGGVVYLRIEDTDNKREIKGAELDIIETFEKFGVIFDESVVKGGDYGPYKQSQRKDIYRTFAKKLVAEGKAYPCFCNSDILSEMREKQQQNKEIPGYYGDYTNCRDLALEEVEKNIGTGKPFVLRFKSFGNANNKIKFKDLIKGEIDVTENHIDHILLKSDGMPTYHLAHIVDDTLMKTTHVVRGEEWLSSLPYHLQLFGAFGYKPPKYMHTPQVLKLENGKKKKMSKRDMGSRLSDYLTMGYPAESMIDYVLTLLNSNFEDWRRANPKKHANEFDFTIQKINSAGSLFDFDKLNDVSKNTLAYMDTETVYQKLTDWTGENDKDFHAELTANPDYAKAFLSIGRGGDKPRKDFYSLSQIKELYGFFYDKYFSYQDGTLKNEAREVVEDYIKQYNHVDSKEEWFEKIKDTAQRHGYCPNTKEYKQNPHLYKGSAGDVSGFIRTAVTGRENSPDLYEVMQIIGREKCLERLNNYINNLKEG